MPETEKLPFEPDTVPSLVPPSPQSIVAVKSEALSVAKLSVKVATSAENWTPSVKSSVSSWA